MKVFTAGVVISLFVIPLIGCRQPVGHGGRAISFARQDGLSVPPGNNEKTRKYFKDKVHFGGIGNQGAVVSFRSSDGRVLPLQVDPEDRAHEVDWFLAARDSYTGGAIVAKIKNISNGTSTELGLSGRNDSVFVWVGPIQDNYAETGVAFYKFDANGNGRRVGSTKYYSVLRCKDSYNTKPSVSHYVNHDDDNPEVCKLTVLGPTAAQVRAAVPPGVQLASHTTMPIVAAYGGLWISCSGGCCDVGGGSFF